MSRVKLKYGGKSRRKALLGADGAVMAAATLAAAGMTTAATIKASNEQSKAAIENAKVQAQSIKDQTNNNNTLQKESLAFTRQQNQENRQQQQDIQTTLQMLAGQENMNDRMEANKLAVKYGGRPKRNKLKSTPFYGGANKQFEVTDGGGAVPIKTDNNGYGLYELYGNDHEHSHKTSNGTRKTGVGIKFKDGSVVEGEGNQNTNKGELLYVTPNDAMFISKHSIKGFNPRDAVMAGVHPKKAFNTQEKIKDIEGLNDDGTKASCGKRISLKRFYGGQTVLKDNANITQNPINTTGDIASGIVYKVNINKSSSPVAKTGKRVSLKRCGGRIKAAFGTNIKNQIKKGLNSDYAGAIYNTAGNMIGAGISAIGNSIAGRKLSSAYRQAGNILSTAYSQMKGIDLSDIKREDYSAPHTLAVVRSANTNINPQLERNRRNAVSEKKEINRGTLSSAARQNRLASTNDRMSQRAGELYAYKQNADEQIKQANAERITQTAASNADRDVQANKDYTATILQAKMYNNDIENAKIAGMAQAKADALTQSASATSYATQANMIGFGSAIGASGQAFASRYDQLDKAKQDFRNNWYGLGDQQKVDAALASGDKKLIDALKIKYNNTINPTQADIKNAYKLGISLRGKSGISLRSLKKPDINNKAINNLIYRNYAS